MPYYGLCAFWEVSYNNTLEGVFPICKVQATILPILDYYNNQR